MPDPPRRPSLRPYVLWSVAIGVLVGVLVVGALAFTGVWSMPRLHADRLPHAILLIAAGYPCFGAIPGLVVGLLLGWSAAPKAESPLTPACGPGRGRWDERVR